MQMSKPPNFSLLLCSANVALILVLVQGSELFPKTCTEMYGSKQTKSSKTDKLEETYTSCGYWGVSRCKNYRKKVVIRTEYIIAFRKRKVCCNGSIPVNETTCTRECPEGKYGSDCRMNCSCPSTGHWSSRCERMTGNCRCENGYQGSRCDEECPEGKYGSDCSMNCSCPSTGHWSSRCDRMTGNCGCGNGYQGSSCDEGCSPGFYGHKCAEQCVCYGESSCNHIDGSCNRTSSGWTGEYSQNSINDTTNMTFRYDCKEKCNSTVNETTSKPGLTGTDRQTGLVDHGRLISSDIKYKRNVIAVVAIILTMLLVIVIIAVGI